EEARRLGAGQVALEAAVDLARIGEFDTAQSVLAELDVVGPLTDARRAVINALAADDVDGLAGAADALERLGALLHAAQATAQRPRPARQAALADAAAGRSGQLAARCQGAATPALQDKAASSSVSARELEVARLAAAGLSNKAIADKLVVSERTVENLLYRAF